MVGGKTERTERMTLTYDQAFRRQRNRMIRTGSLQEKDHWERLHIGWMLIPSDTRSTTITCETEEAQVAAVRKLLEDTGALQKLVLLQAESSQKREKDEVDATVLKVVCVAIVGVVGLSFISIQHVNNVKQQELIERDATKRG